MTTPEDRLRALDAWAGADYRHPDPAGLVDRVVEAGRVLGRHRRRVAVLAPSGVLAAVLAATLAVVLPASAPVATSALDLRGARWTSPSGLAVTSGHGVAAVSVPAPNADGTNGGLDQGYALTEGTAFVPSRAGAPYGSYYVPTLTAFVASTESRLGPVRFVAAPTLARVAGTATVFDLVGPSDPRGWALRLARGLGVAHGAAVHAARGEWRVAGPTGELVVRAFASSARSGVSWGFVRSLPACHGTARDRHGAQVSCLQWWGLEDGATAARVTTQRAQRVLARLPFAPLVAATPVRGLDVATARFSVGAANPPGLALQFSDHGTLLDAVGLGARLGVRGTYRTLSARDAVRRLATSGVHGRHPAHVRVVVLVRVTLDYAPVVLRDGTTVLVPVYAYSDAQGDTFVALALTIPTRALVGP